MSHDQPARENQGTCRHHARRLPITGDIQPEKNLAISGRSAFLGVESREGESLASAATLDTLGEALEVLLETQALDLMGACPLVLGSCAGVSTQVGVDTGRGGGGPCTACKPSTLRHFQNITQALSRSSSVHQDIIGFCYACQDCLDMSVLLLLPIACRCGEEDVGMG